MASRGQIDRVTSARRGRFLMLLRRNAEARARLARGENPQSVADDLNLSPTAIAQLRGQVQSGARS